MKKIVFLLIGLIFFPGYLAFGEGTKESSQKLKICKVITQKVQSFIEAGGTVQADVEGSAKLLSPLSGAVEKVFVKIGDSVKRGDSLVALRSSDVSDVSSNHLSALVQLRQFERVYNLNKQLFEIGAVTKNDLLNSQANYDQQKVLVDGLKKKLEIYGTFKGNGLQDKLILKAPIDGAVVELQAHLGDRFDTTTSLMTIVNPEKILIVANIFDTYVSKIERNKEVTFQTDVFPGQSFQGIVTYISDVEDQESKTVKAYIKLSENKNVFKQNMFLRMKILETERSYSVIPKSTIIYKEGRFFVKLQKDGEVKEVSVKPICDVSDKMSAVEGVNEGDEVVESAIEMETP
ncbi:MAG: efflux RND transporter periplasmic adaptor subunit [Candidatus Riflebacteria bacterium]|nr:efflux RND transporter periplasmic adaptor subunit [Candidatus Riflebacteria bacterium]